MRSDNWRIAMTVFEMLGYETKSFIAGAAYATAFCAMSWFMIVWIASRTSKGNKDFQRMRRKLR